MTRREFWPIPACDARSAPVQPARNPAAGFLVPGDQHEEAAEAAAHAQGRQAATGVLSMDIGRRSGNYRLTAVDADGVTHGVDFKGEANLVTAFEVLWNQMHPGCHERHIAEMLAMAREMAPN